MSVTAHYAYWRWLKVYARPLSVSLDSKAIALRTPHSVLANFAGRRFSSATGDYTHDPLNKRNRDFRQSSAWLSASLQ